MLKFDPFVSFRTQMLAAKEKASRANEYRRFVRETLAKFQVEDMHDLDDESYGRFLDELKGYRKGRLVAEGLHTEETAAQNPALERYRADCLDELRRHSSRIRHIVSEVVDTPFTCYISGPVSDPYGFTASSGVDISVVVEAGPAAGDLARMLQRRMLFGFGFGPLGVSVNNGPPAAGWVRL
jgi:hypothetical protein